MSSRKAITTSVKIGSDRAEKFYQWAPSILFALAILLNWPYLTAGFYADDFVLIDAFTNPNYVISRWLGAWISTNAPMFTNLWWMDSNFMISFWRPLSSLMIQTSVILFGKNPMPLHLFSIILHGLVAILLYRLVLRLSDFKGLAFLSALLYVACEDHSTTIAWVSTISDILCTLNTLIFLLLYLSFLRKNHAGCLFFSLIFLIGALASKETAIVSPLVALIFALFFPSGQYDQTARISLNRIKASFTYLVKRPLRWLPLIIVMLIYLVIYKSMNLGNSNSLQYFDPLSDPLGFLKNAVSQLPVIWLGAFTIWPPFVSSIISDIIPYLIIPGCLIFLFVLLGLKPLLRYPLTWCSLLTFLVTLIPQLCTSAGERGLYLPMIGGSIMVALLILAIGPIAKRVSYDLISASRWTKVIGWYMTIFVLVIGLLISILRPFGVRATFEEQAENVKTSLDFLRNNPSKNLIVTDASDIFQTFYIQSILAYYGYKTNVYMLSGAPGNFTLEKNSKNSFTIRTDRPGWINNTFARYVRTKDTVAVGDTYNKGLFTATIEEVTEDSKDVLAVKFDLASPEMPGDLNFMTWQGDRYKPLIFDELAVGEVIKLAPNRGLLEMIMPRES